MFDHVQLVGFLYSHMLPPAGATAVAQPKSVATDPEYWGLLKRQSHTQPRVTSVRTRRFTIRRKRHLKDIEGF